jgi:glutaredoxin-related protein
MRELDGQGKLSHQFPQTEIIAASSQKIEKLVMKGRVMVFIRGTPEHPVCLQSKRMMDLLNRYPKCMKELEHYDITKDP